MVTPNGEAALLSWKLWPSAVNSSTWPLSSTATTLPPYAATEITAPSSWPTWVTWPPGCQTQDLAAVGADADHAGAGAEPGDGVALQPGDLGRW